MNQTLHAIFHTDEGDLAANRAGRISEGQAQRHQAEMRTNLFIMLGVFAGVAVVIMVVLALIGGAEIIPFMVVGLLAFLGVIVWYYRKGAADISKGTVEQASGIFALEVKSRQTARRSGPANRRQQTNDYFLRVGELSFRVTKQRFDELEQANIEGQQVTVYYMPGALRVVSMEMGG